MIFVCVQRRPWQACWCGASALAPAFSTPEPPAAVLTADSHTRTSCCPRCLWQRWPQASAAAPCRPQAAPLASLHTHATAAALPAPCWRVAGLPPGPRTVVMAEASTPAPQRTTIWLCLWAVAGAACWLWSAQAAASPSLAVCTAPSCDTSVHFHGTHACPAPTPTG
jgi:hypothetical protein